MRQLENRQIQRKHILSLDKEKKNFIDQEDLGTKVASQLANVE